MGGNLAATPGSVVLRTDVFELIQYQPRTESVREVPLLFVPPTINKYYVLDIAPDRSMIAYFVKQGQQVFTISWLNPSHEQRAFDFDTYAGAVLAARDAVAAITGSAAVHVCAACSGGLIAAGVVNHIVATDRRSSVASLALLVCAIDNEQAGTVSALTSREIAAAAVAESARKGYLDGRALQGVFTWLRPNDLVWSYVVNNYLLGKEPPAFDILYWNQDRYAWQRGCIATSSASRWTTRWRALEDFRRSARRSISQQSMSTCMPSLDSATTSCRGRTHIAACSSSAVRPDSSCRPAGTSRRS